MPRGEEKMEKTMLVSVVVGMLLVGIVSAGLVGYLSNVVSGSVVVEGPVFYLDLDEGGSNNQLLINEIGSDKQKDWNDEISFESDDLGVDVFYESTFKSVLWIKADGSSNSVKIEVRKKDGNLICESTEQAVSSSSHSKKEFECSSSGDITLGVGEGFKLIIVEMTGTPASMSIRSGYSYSDGYDRMEVSKV